MCQAIKELVEAGEKRGMERGIAKEKKNAEREKKRADSAESELRAVKQRVEELEKQLSLLS